MPAKRNNYWKEYRKTKRAAFKKKHGMSEYMYKKHQIQQAHQMWKAKKQQHDKKQLDKEQQLDALV